MICAKKKQYDNRMAAIHALGVTRSMFRYRRETEQTATAIYQCQTCGYFHLTKKLYWGQDEEIQERNK